MSKPESSYRDILRSSSIVGGASVINIGVGLVRTKVAAVLLGPAGIGLIGLFQSLVTTASSVSALGLGTVGTRQVAEAVGHDDAEGVAASRRALFWGTLALSVVGAAVFWALRDVLAARVLDDPSLAGAVGWLSIGVALTVAAGSQAALLKGLRHVGDIARVSVYSAVLSTVVGVAAVWAWGQGGLVAFVLAAPLASFVLGHVYVARLPRVRGTTPLRVLASQWRVLARLGAAFMVAGVVASLGNLVLRTIIQRTLDAAALGYFQAAWAISMTYIGFVLQAMGTDYYPRLTAAMDDPAHANRLVNEQTEVALLLAGPVFLGMLALAPWVMTLLYSGQFTAAVGILRWQILGDILKVASWPLGFVILAAGHGRTFMLTQSLSVVALVGLSWLGLPHLGIEATGVAFLGMYAILLPVVYVVARRTTGFRWDAGVLRHLVALTTVAAVVSGVAAGFERTGAALGLLAAAVFGIHAVGRLGHMANLGGPLGRVAALSRRLLTRLGLGDD